MDKAGAYGIQAIGGTLVKGIVGKGRHTLKKFFLVVGSLRGAGVKPHEPLRKGEEKDSII